MSEKKINDDSEIRASEIAKSESWVSKFTEFINEVEEIVQIKKDGKCVEYNCLDKLNILTKLVREVVKTIEDEDEKIGTYLIFSFKKRLESPNNNHMRGEKRYITANYYNLIVKFLEFGKEFRKYLFKEIDNSWKKTISDIGL